METDPMPGDALQSWIGRKEESEDAIVPQLARRFQATFDLSAEPPSDTLLGIHWCLNTAAAPTAAIGSDGHPARGGFLPPIELPRRMWAGGELDFIRPLRVGDAVRRVSTIADIAFKQGKSGPLGFVTLRHDYATALGPVLQERQDIVYRAMPSGPEPARITNGQAQQAQWQRSVPVDPVMLFRYSALTFNAHRIHYDRHYAMEIEHYPGLVVHGPLQATWLLQFASHLRSGTAPRRFSFRSQAPLFDGDAVTLNAVERPDGLALWTAAGAGHVAMSAEARW